MKSQTQKIETLHRLGWRFGLRTTRSLIAELGITGDELRFIHVAGTNGKGSTCAFLQSILSSAGLKTGLYTSPHLCDPRERFRINGEWINESDYERLAGRVLNACCELKKAGLDPTYFEAHTALAMLWFIENKVDLVVWETGLGGRLDATTVIQRPLLSLITPVALEHQEFLGKTVGEIAGEKAGILKRGSFAVTLQHDANALGAIRQRALEIGACLSFEGDDFNYRSTERGFRFDGLGRRLAFDLGSHSSFDTQNAVLAVAAIFLLEHHGIKISTRVIQTGLAICRWPGRFEMISDHPPVLLDGAHNPAATIALSQALKTRYPGKKWIVLNGYLGDKDHKACVEALAPHAMVSIVTDPPSDRAGNGFRVHSAWESQGVPSLYVKDWQKAFQIARAKTKGKHGLLITGSLYLVGSCREALVGLRGLGRI